MSETMADYEDQINASFRSFREGDTVTGEVVSVEEEEVLLDLRSFSQGVIPSGEYSDDPNFHAMDEIRTGEMLTAAGFAGSGKIVAVHVEGQYDRVFFSHGALLLSARPDTGCRRH